MNYQEQIEKTALNAQKARAMAKEVGIMPQGAWKYGLRKSRNMKTGELLKGRELSEAHKKLGKLPNNTYQKIKSKSRKLASFTEVGGVLDNQNKIKDLAVGKVRAGGVKDEINGKTMSFHTHPGNAGEGRFTFGTKLGVEGKMRFGSKYRNPLVADLSGKIQAQGGSVNMNKQQLGQAIKKFEDGDKARREAVKVTSMKSKLPSRPSEDYSASLPFSPLPYISNKHIKMFDKMMEAKKKRNNISSAINIDGSHYNARTSLAIRAKYGDKDNLLKLKDRAYNKFIKKKESQLPIAERRVDKYTDLYERTPLSVPTDTPAARKKHADRKANRNFVDSLEANKLKIRNKLQAEEDRLINVASKKKKPIRDFVGHEGGDFDINGILRGYNIGDNDTIIPKYTRKNHNIVAPDQNIEGVHRMQGVSDENHLVPNQRVRSIFFDRSPRKSR